MAISVGSMKRDAAHTYTKSLKSRYINKLFSDTYDDKTKPLQAKGSSALPSIKTLDKKNLKTGFSREVVGGVLLSHLQRFILESPPCLRCGRPRKSSFRIWGVLEKLNLVVSTTWNSLPSDLLALLARLANTFTSIWKLFFIARVGLWLLLSEPSGGILETSRICYMSPLNEWMNEYGYKN